jgi:hypothetical protein
MVKLTLIVALLLAGVKSDLPVKCPKHETEVGSIWTFHVNKDK